MRPGFFSKSEIGKIKGFSAKDDDAKREDGDLKEINEITNRSPYSRDRDRILYTKSFRRLAHKTQVYLTSENTPDHSDHIRTRLTHTLEVAQIAKTIARYLLMNEDLVEAIAFGHDVGHAPFGHAGEHQLNNLLNGKIDLRYHQTIAHKFLDSFLADEQLFRSKLNLGDFRHNFQSVRQLTFLDTYRSHYKGLNLTYQCLDGILRHTGISNFDKNRNICKYPGVSDGLLEQIINYVGFTPTVEAKIVSLADEIAQVCHDLYDAIDLDVLTFEELSSKVGEPLDVAVEHLSSLGKVVHFGAQGDHKQENNRKLCSLLISHFTISTTIHIGNALKERNVRGNIADIINEIPDIPGPANGFKAFKDIKNDFVINNYNVNRMDNKGRYIIRQLYYAYLTDPRQLPDSELKRFIHLKKIELHNKNRDGVKRWMVESGEVLKEKYRLTATQQDDIVGIIRNDTHGTCFRKLAPETVEQIIPYLCLDGDYVRVIVDYIASMTDGFAEKEVSLLYGG